MELARKLLNSKGLQESSEPFIGVLVLNASVSIEEPGRNVGLIKLAEIELNCAAKCS